MHSILNPPRPSSAAGQRNNGPCYETGISTNSPVIDVNLQE